MIDRKKLNIFVSAGRYVVVIICIAMMIIVMPISELFNAIKVSSSSDISMLVGTILRYLFAIYFAFASISLGVKMSGKTTAKSLLVLLPALTIAINNFPFITYFSLDASITSSGAQIVLLALFCLAVGCFEEVLFRGILLPLVYVRVKNKPRSVPLSVIVSSVIFGLIHLVNLFGGFSPMVLLQVGYSFLIGGLCAIVYLTTQNIIFPILTHAIYDFAGKLCVGVYWTGASITLTAVISVVVVAIMLVALMRLKASSLDSLKGSYS